MTYYHLAHGDFSADGDYIITKLTPDFVAEATYNLSLRECTCPAGHRPTCRHRQMLPTFLAAGHISDGYLLSWPLLVWLPPHNPDGSDPVPSAGEAPNLAERAESAPHLTSQPSTLPRRTLA